MVKGVRVRGVRVVKGVRAGECEETGWCEGDEGCGSVWNLLPPQTGSVTNWSPELQSSSTSPMGWCTGFASRAGPPEDETFSEIGKRTCARVSLSEFRDTEDSSDDSSWRFALHELLSLMSFALGNGGSCACSDTDLPFIGDDVKVNDGLDVSAFTTNIVSS